MEVASAMIRWDRTEPSQRGGCLTIEMEHHGETQISLTETAAEVLKLIELGRYSVRVPNKGIG